MSQDRCLFLSTDFYPLLFRLAVLDNYDEALLLYTTYSDKLVPLINSLPSLTTHSLQELCDAIRSKPNYSVTHICVQRRFLQALRDRHIEIIRLVAKVNQCPKSFCLIALKYLLK